MTKMSISSLPTPTYEQIKNAAGGCSATTKHAVSRLFHARWTRNRHSFHVSWQPTPITSHAHPLEYFEIGFLLTVCLINLLNLKANVH